MPRGACRPCTHKNVNTNTKILHPVDLAVVVVGVVVVVFRMTVAGRPENKTDDPEGEFAG